MIRMIWAMTWQNQQSDCAPSEDTDQPGHLPSLIRVFAVRMKKPQVLSYPLSAQRRLWSDWVDAQADLSLRWVYSHFVGFVMSRLISIESLTKPPHDKTNKMTFAPSEDSDQPGHPSILIRFFAVCSMGSWEPSVSSCGQWRLIRLGGFPGWSESLLGAKVTLLVLSWGGKLHQTIILVRMTKFYR